MPSLIPLVVMLVAMIYSIQDISLETLEEEISKKRSKISWTES